VEHLIPITDRTSLRSGEVLCADHWGMVWLLRVERSEGIGTVGYVLEDGQWFRSLSAAARAVARSSRNGWLFWRRFADADEGRRAWAERVDGSTQDSGSDEPPLGSASSAAPVQESPTVASPARVPVALAPDPAAVQRALDVARAESDSMPTEDDLAAALRTLIQVGVPMARLQALFTP